MINADPVSWLLILVGFGALAIAAFIIRTYRNRYKDIKEKIHAIHNVIELIDESLKDDKVDKEEFQALIRACLDLLSDLI